MSFKNSNIKPHKFRNCSNSADKLELFVHYYDSDSLFENKLFSESGNHSSVVSELTDHCRMFNKEMEGC